jgi:oligopeptide/dipeptide ABC transporter ATP-binding protein
MALLAVHGLATHFDTEDGGVIRAVDGVSFTLDRGEVLCLVGESGSGKTVAALSLLQLVPCPPGRIVAGRMLYRDSRGGGEVDLARASGAELRHIRGNRIAMVFQDPMTSLNPYLTIGTQLGEVLEAHGGKPRAGAGEILVGALRDMGISAPEQRLRDYPHQLSGGMRQRVMIAMALLCDPDLLLADEPTTALDVTVQAQILRHMAERKEALGLGVLWITHDLGVVARIADRVAVMYGGRIVEQGPVAQVLRAPRHPYTAALQRSVPRLDAAPGTPLYALEGTPPRVDAELRGCPFRPRCSRALAVCAVEFPAERAVDEAAPSPSPSPSPHCVCCHAELGEP